MNFKSLNIMDSVMAIKNGALIIDVREQTEYDEAHLENGVLIPLSELSTTKINEINPENKPIIIHCRSGQRSKVAANILLSQNYTGEILEINEGINGWIEANQFVLSNI